MISWSKVKSCSKDWILLPLICWLLLLFRLPLFYFDNWTLLGILLSWDLLYLWWRLLGDLLKALGDLFLSVGLGILLNTLLGLLLMLCFDCDFIRGLLGLFFIGVYLYLSSIFLGVALTDGCLCICSYRVAILSIFVFSCLSSVTIFFILKISFRYSFYLRILLLGFYSSLLMCFSYEVVKITLRTWSKFYALIRAISSYTLTACSSPS